MASRTVVLRPGRKVVMTLDGLWIELKPTLRKRAVISRRKDSSLFVQELGVAVKCT